MRHIQKQHQTLPCLEEFVEAQVRGREENGGEWGNLLISYGAFSRTRDLKAALIEEQFGLCAYTGAGIDADGLQKRRAINQPQAASYWFIAHVEHLKPQSQCRAELEAAGGVYGRDRGEDLAYHNVVAAMLVSGARNQQFGAAVRGDQDLPVWPASPACESAFFFFEDGDMMGATEGGEATVSTLLLRHKTLCDWRFEAIEEYLPERENTPVEELRRIIQLMETPRSGRLPDFCFVIARLARQYLQIQEQRVAGSSN